MPKKAKELGAKAVANLTRPGMHAVGGVAGLALQVIESGARSWVLRVTVGGKRRDMGMGGFPDVTLPQRRPTRVSGLCVLVLSLRFLENVMTNHCRVPLVRYVAAGVVSAVLCFVSSASAGPTYSYMGHAYESSLVSPPGVAFFPDPALSGRKVLGSVTFDSWQVSTTVSDVAGGISTLTFTEPRASMGFTAADLTGWSFSFDSAGDILQFSVSAEVFGLEHWSLVVDSSSDAVTLEDAGAGTPVTRVDIYRTPVPSAAWTCVSDCSPNSRVSEPTTLALLGLALAGVGWTRRRRA